MSPTPTYTKIGHLKSMVFGYHNNSRTIGYIYNSTQSTTLLLALASFTVHIRIHILTAFYTFRVVTSYLMVKYNIS